MSYLGADWLTRPERIREEDPDRLIEALHLRPGMVVADIGAGVGYHVWRIAPRVKPGGRVLATDLQPEMLAALERNMKERGIDNVVPVQSSQDATGLPDAGVDLALMVDVYHELADPQRFLAELRRALRPGGRVALVEFRAEDPKVPIRPEHRMTAAQVQAELAEARFCPVESYEELPWQHLLVFSVAGRCGCAQPDRPLPDKSGR
jgi:ubiquinone/menaquinone biosynthesis C-methylase UbiE